LNQGNVRKYTAYTDRTGITLNHDHSSEDEQCSDSSKVGNGWRDSFFEESVNTLTEKINMFSKERKWERFHTPRNLHLAVIGELGELAELFQFRGDEDNQSMTISERVVIGLELADVTMYLLRLAEACSEKVPE
jgi:hypothetical protein